MIKKLAFIIISAFLTWNAFPANRYTLLVGNWKGVTATGARSNMVFFPDGEILIIVRYSDGRKVSLQRRYTFVGDRIFIASNSSVNAYTLQVITLNNNELIVRNEAGQTLSYTRVRRR